MATVTRLGAYGGPRQKTGSFAGKEIAGSVRATVTRLGPHGGPRHKYDSFAGKEAASGGPTPRATVTRLGAYGGPRQRYGSFAGKEESAVVVQFPDSGGGLRQRQENKDMELFQMMINVLNAIR